MKAITLVRPMDWAIIKLDPPKDVENRVWKPPQDVIEKFICIHSGQRWDEGYWNFISDVIATSAGMSAQGFNRIDESTWWGGRIVGVVRVVSCTNNDRSRWAMFGQWHWRLADRIALKHPVPAKGSQKLWVVPPGPAALVQSQVPSSVVFA